MNSSEEEQAEFLQTGALQDKHNGNQVENTENVMALDDSWECISHSCLTDKRAGNLGQAQVIKLFSNSTQLSTKFILLINVQMPTIVGILTLIA